MWRVQGRLVPSKHSVKTLTLLGGGDLHHIYRLILSLLLTKTFKTSSQVVTLWTSCLCNFRTNAVIAVLFYFNRIVQCPVHWKLDILEFTILHSQHWWECYSGRTRDTALQTILTNLYHSSQQSSNQMLLDMVIQSIMNISNETLILFIFNLSVKV